MGVGQYGGCGVIVAQEFVKLLETEHNRSITPNEPMAELGDASVLGTDTARCVDSNSIRSTNKGMV